MLRWLCSPKDLCLCFPVGTTDLVVLVGTADLAVPVGFLADAAAADRMTQSLCLGHSGMLGTTDLAVPEIGRAHV